MKNRKLVNIILIIMAILSFTNIFGLSMSGLSVILGLFFFFIIKNLDKQTFYNCGLDIKTVPKILNNPKIWLWIAMPLLMNIIVIFLSKLILPTYIEHVISRSSVLLSSDKIILLVVELAIFALGEEIAWRAFFQQRLSNIIPVVPAILISSALFSLGHLTNCDFMVVIYDLFFVFINAIFYGIIFKKTNNAWISTISHFIANLFGLIIMFIL